MAARRDGISSPLFFLHIRKTAGSTVRNSVADRFAVADMLLDWHHRQKFDRDPSAFSFVTGHCAFDVVRRFSTRPRILVFLRDPLERALSAYSFYRGHTTQQLDHFRATLPGPVFSQRERFTQRASQLGLTRFLRQEEDLARLWLSNVQTRVLGGATDGYPAPLPDSDLLATARANLARCDVVGLVERMAASLRMLARAQGWVSLDLQRHDHRTPGRLRRHEVPPEALEILTGWNRLDVELYREASRLFEKRLRASSSATGKLRPDDPLLPSASDYVFDQAFAGHGWHPRESYRGRWIRWTEQLEATLDFRLDTAGPHRLECRLEHVLAPRVLEGLRIFVDRTQLSWRSVRRGEETWLCASVPEEALPARHGRARVRFVVGETVCPADISPGTADGRRLGIALSRVRLRPSAT